MESVSFSISEYCRLSNVCGMLKAAPVTRFTILEISVADTLGMCAVCERQ